MGGMNRTQGIATLWQNYDGMKKSDEVGKKMQYGLG